MTRAFSNTLEMETSVTDSAILTATMVGATFSAAFLADLEPSPTFGHYQ
jgi:hypothetical protein